MFPVGGARQPMASCDLADLRPRGDLEEAGLVRRHDDLHLSFREAGEKRGSKTEAADDPEPLPGLQGEDLEPTDLLHALDESVEGRLRVGDYPVGLPAAEV